MTITTQFVNETQGEDLKNEPILITVDSPFELAFDITGTQQKTMVATVNSLKAFNSYRAQNSNDNEDARERYLSKLDQIKDAVNTYVNTGVGVALLELIEKPEDLEDLTSIGNDYYGILMQRMNVNYELVDAILLEITNQLGIETKDIEE